MIMLLVQLITINAMRIFQIKAERGSEMKQNGKGTLEKI